MHAFDREYWEDHWAPVTAPEASVHPYLLDETAHLPRGTALDAGCGAGAEALWLAAQGWRVTAADISATALAVGAEGAGLGSGIEWVRTDLTAWEPERRWDLVFTGYAHPATSQLAFYRRLSSWVAPGGTLLILAHRQDAPRSGGTQPDHPHPEQATATLTGITSLFPAPGWRIEAGYDAIRTVQTAGPAVQLHDVVVRARRIR